MAVFTVGMFFGPKITITFTGQAGEKFAGQGQGKIPI
jgi:hypothetical protein